MFIILQFKNTAYARCSLKSKYQWEAIATNTTIYKTKCAISNYSFVNGSCDQKAILTR